MSRPNEPVTVLRLYSTLAATRWHALTLAESRQRLAVHSLIQAGAVWVQTGGHSRARALSARANERAFKGIELMICSEQIIMICNPSLLYPDDD